MKPQLDEKKQGIKRPFQDEIILPEQPPMLKRAGETLIQSLDILQMSICLRDMRGMRGSLVTPDMSGDIYILYLKEHAKQRYDR